MLSSFLFMGSTTIFIIALLIAFIITIIAFIKIFRSNLINSENNQEEIVNFENNNTENVSRNTAVLNYHFDPEGETEVLVNPNLPNFEIANTIDNPTSVSNNVEMEAVPCVKNSFGNKQQTEPVKEDSKFEAELLKFDLFQDDISDNQGISTDSQKMETSAQENFIKRSSEQKQQETTFLQYVRWLSSATDYYLKSQKESLIINYLRDLPSLQIVDGIFQLPLSRVLINGINSSFTNGSLHLLAGQRVVILFDINFEMPDGYAMQIKMHEVAAREDLRLIKIIEPDDSRDSIKAIMFVKKDTVIYERESIFDAKLINK